MRIIHTTIALFIVIMAVLYYRYSIDTIPEKITESDQTMLMTDSMRHVFKVYTLNQKAYYHYLVAVQQQDLNLIYESLDYIDASIGFIFSGYIDNKALAKDALPYINSNQKIIQEVGLEPSKKDILRLKENIDQIGFRISDIEKSIWVQFQKDFVKFQSNEYKLKTLYEVAAIVFLLGSIGMAYLAARQKKLIRELEEKEKQLFKQANFDSITDLPNRYLLDDRLKYYLKESKRRASKTAVFFIDIDDFKKINDSLGHETGDALLAEVGKRLKNNLRETDSIGRWGGDEYVVISDELDKTLDAASIAADILHNFLYPFEIGERSLTVTASIGIAVYPNDGADQSVLLRNADAAMYSAKASGRNHFMFYAKEMNQVVSRRLEIENHLYGAIERGEISVHFQPKVDIKSNTIHSVEALVRWNNPALGFVPPDEFIPVAEQSGSIKELGLYVLEQSLTAVKQWQQEFGSSFTIAVNLSPVQLKHPDFHQMVKQYLDNHQLSGNSLEFEITEGVLMDTHLQVKGILSHLTNMQIRFSMDDFGTGYSSLSYLRDFSFSVLKIDRSFINGMEDNPANQKLVEATVAMAHALRLKVVAEGVETQEQLQLLSELGCNLAQGYYFSKPIPFAAVTEVIRQHNQPG